MAAADLASQFSAGDYSKYLAEMNLEDWDEDSALAHFAYLRTSLIFPVATIPRYGEVSVLQETPDSRVAEYRVSLSDGQELSFDELITTVAPVDGLVILHRGRIVYESYPHMFPFDKHLIFSTSKAFIGTLVGILEAKGLVRVDSPIEEYIPELAGSDWAGTVVRDILDMCSGIAAQDGDIVHPASEHYRLEASLGWLPLVDELPDAVKEGRTYDYLRTLGRATPPGVVHSYSSANTTVLAWLIEKVTGLALFDALFQFIWSKISAESDAQIVVNKTGVGVAHAGLITHLRDLARLGLLFTPGWRTVAAHKVIPDELIQRIQHGRPGLEEMAMLPAMLRQDRVGAYQWDRVLDNGAFFKSGYAGQMLYVSPGSDLVAAFFGSTEFHGTNPPFALIVFKLLRELFENGTGE